MMDLRPKIFPDPNISALNLFSDNAHRSFFHNSGQPAALFVHGFMGTPAEIRPLADIMHEEGWTVEGLLLPGFGSQIDTLFQRSWTEWRDAVIEAVLDLQMHHSPVVLVGYSMGAAVALKAAAEVDVDGLILLAPFWKIGNNMHRAIWQVIKHIFRNPKLFSKANFTDQRIKGFFEDILPELDLEDPDVQERLRSLRVPARFADQVFEVGRQAERAAVDLAVPVYILQGTHDMVILPAQTRRLLQRFPGPVTYAELETDHKLVHEDNPGFAQVARSLLSFARNIAVPELPRLASF